MQSPVRVSDLSLYQRCPRLVYFDSMGALAPPAPNPAGILLRHLMLSIDTSLEGADISSSRDSPVDCRGSGGSGIPAGSGGPGSLEEIRAALSAALHRIASEIPLIYESIDSTAVSAAAAEIEAILPDIASMPFERLHPYEADLDLRSDRLGLSGRLDRLVRRQVSESAVCRAIPLSESMGRTATQLQSDSDSICPVPSIIRSGPPPEMGIWKRDRIQLAGYSILLEDRFSRPVRTCQVEFPRAGEVREVQIRSVDRARALRIRDRVRQIRRGVLPDRPKDAPCESCNVREICETRRSLASMLF